MVTRWQQAIVPKGASIQAALECISISDLRIALVVDADKRLAGVITDGDIRRGLMRSIRLTDPVEQIMNAAPRTAAPGATREQLLEMMKRHDLMHVPIVEDGRVVGLAMLQDFVEEIRYHNPVCIMAGGLGRRLRPLTDEVPKPLLKIGGKPILESVLENFVESGFKRFYISIHYKPEQIINYFGDGRRWNVEIEYLLEDQPLGTGGALGLLPETIGDLPLVVMNGDLVTQVDFARVLAFHQEQRAAATICVTEHEVEVPYGVVESEGEVVSDILEKPVHHFRINAGMYVLDPSVVRSVARDCAVDMPSLLKERIRAGGRVVCFPLHERWLDIGQMSDFERAQAEIERRRP